MISEVAVQREDEVIEVLAAEISREFKFNAELVIVQS